MMFPAEFYLKQNQVVVQKDLTAMWTEISVTSQIFDNSNITRGHTPSHGHTPSSHDMLWSLNYNVYTLQYCIFAVWKTFHLCFWHPSTASWLTSAIQRDPWCGQASNRIPVLSPLAHFIILSVLWTSPVSKCGYTEHSITDHWETNMLPLPTWSSWSLPRHQK